MRLRNNPKARTILLENNDLVIIDPKNHKGQINKLFNNNNPIYIEIGMGKGDFIYQHAKKNPSINYIGIEKYPSVLAVAVAKVKAQGMLENLRFMDFDASSLTEVFNVNEVDKVYLNFSDPWPKSRHAKRRLTYKSFLDVYKNILKIGHSIEFKTDNRLLFEYSLVSFNEYKMKYDYVSLDLHSSPEFETNIMTEYEMKFCKKGPIYKFVGRFE